MADTVLYAPFFQGEDANGNPLAGAKLYFYLANTTTKITIYQDSLAATPHQNPVVADSAGMFPPIFLAAGQALFKTELTTSAGSVIQTADGISSVQRYSATFADLIAKWTPASASGPASLDFAEDADNGTNRVRVTVPSTLAADYSFVLPAANVTLDTFIVTLLNSTTAAGAQVAIGVREVLTANRTYYVRTDGSDSNNGLANTSGGAFLTIQKAFDTVSMLDCSTYTAVVQVGAGTWTAGATWNGHVGTGAVILRGDTTTPTNVVLNRTGGNDITFGIGAKLTVEGFDLGTVTSGHCIQVRAFGQLTLGVNNFRAAANSHIRADNLAQIACTANYTISGGAARHIDTSANCAFGYGSNTITLSGTPAFTEFIYASLGSMISLFSTTFSGSATGKRYTIDGGAVINTYGAGTASTYFPGNANGTAAAASYAVQI